MVNRLKLHKMAQGPDQPVQQYVASLKQIARTCRYSVQCSRQGCNTNIDYSNEMVLDQLVRGLNDDDIQKKVLSCPEENFNLAAVEKIIIAEECSKATQKESKSSFPSEQQLAPISTFKKSKKKPITTSSNKKCSSCGSEGHKNFSELSEENKGQCKANGKFCENCGKKNHLASVCRSSNSNKSGEKSAENSGLTLSTIATDNVYACHQIGAVTTDAKSRRRFLGHVHYDKKNDKFVSKAIRQDNILKVDIVVDKVGYKSLGGNHSLN